MKFLKRIVFVLFLFVLGLFKVNASSALINVSTNKTSVVVGNSITVTVKISSTEAIGAWEYDLSYDNSILKLTSGTAHVVDYATSSSIKTKSYTYTFKCLKSGTSNISVSNYNVISFNENPMETQISKTRVKVITNEQLQQSYSKNNYLKTLTIDKGTLSPIFNKDTLEYNVEVENGVTSVVIGATLEDKKAKLSGIGTINVTEGVNKIEVKVTAENGNVRSYIINVTVKELSPIVVKIDDKEYSVIRKEGVLDPPSNYVKTTTLINGEEVLSYKNEITDYTLVGLKDSQGSMAYYIYKDDTFSLYREINFNKMSVALLKMDKSIIPDGYFKTVIGIDNKEVEVYKLNESSNYSLLYGVNTDTGEKNLYVYDSREHTIQIYNDEEISILNEKNNYKSKIIIGLVIGLGIVIIAFVVYALLINKRCSLKEISLKRELLAKEKKERELS